MTPTPVRSSTARPRGATAPRSGIQVLGNMKTSVAAEHLKAIGDVELARSLARMPPREKNRRFSLARLLGKKPDPVFRYTEHAFGYLPKTAGKADVPISDAGNIEPDATLKGSAVKVTLDRLRVFAYPGGGTHTILFDFRAQHQTSDQGDSQDLRVAQHYRVQDGGGAGISGYPVFVGLKVGSEGVSFRCSTVNVSNKEDQQILRFLGGDVFKKGVQLISQVNPVLPIVTAFATGIIETFAQRNDNVGVQDFFLGLDFSGIATRAQLREGSYIAVQVPDLAEWDWSKWVFKPATGQIVSTQDGKSVPLNYVVFSVSKLT